MRYVFFPASIAFISVIRKYYLLLWLEHKTEFDEKDLLSAAAYSLNIICTIPNMETKLEFILKSIAISFPSHDYT